MKESDSSMARTTGLVTASCVLAGIDKPEMLLREYLPRKIYRTKLLKMQWKLCTEGVSIELHLW